MGKRKPPLTIAIKKYNHFTFYGEVCMWKSLTQAADITNELLQLLHINLQQEFPNANIGILFSWFLCKL